MQRTCFSSKTRPVWPAFQSSAAHGRCSTRRQFRHSPESAAADTSPAPYVPLTPSEEVLQQQANCKQEKLPLHTSFNTQPHSSMIHPLLPHQPLKYAQMGHSSFSRGAPHVCYWHLNGSGVFYMKPDGDELLANWKNWWTDKQHHVKQSLSSVSPKQQLQGALFTGFSSSSGLQDQLQQENGLLHMRILHSIQSATWAAAAAAISSYRSLLAPLDDTRISPLRALLFVVAAVACVLLAMSLGRWLIEWMILCYSGLMLH